MKVIKFGRIFLNENGDMVVTKFEFETEKAEENPNCAEHVMPAIINYLCNVWHVSEINQCADRTSEMIVAGAIEKARISSDA